MSRSSPSAGSARPQHGHDRRSVTALRLTLSTAAYHRDSRGSSLLWTDTFPHGIWTGEGCRHRVMEGQSAELDVHSPSHLPHAGAGVDGYERGLLLAPGAC